MVIVITLDSGREHSLRASVCYNNNNKIQHLYSAIFIECSMALYIVSRTMFKIILICLFPDDK